MNPVAVISINIGLVLVGFIFVYWLANILEDPVKDWISDNLTTHIKSWVKKHEKTKRIFISVVNSIKTLVKTSLYLLVFAFMITALAEMRTNAYKNSRSAHQKRLDFPGNNCTQIDYGYEILNHGKSTYKCPNGKEYSE